MGNVVEVLCEIEFDFDGGVDIVMVKFVMGYFDVVVVVVDVLLVLVVVY